MAKTDKQIREDDFEMTKKLNIETLSRVLHSLSSKTVDDLPVMKQLQCALDGVNI